MAPVGVARRLRRTLYGWWVGSAVRLQEGQVQQIATVTSGSLAGGRRDGPGEKHSPQSQLAVDRSGGVNQRGQKRARSTREGSGHAAAGAGWVVRRPGRGLSEPLTAGRSGSSAALACTYPRLPSHPCTKRDLHLQLPQVFAHGPGQRPWPLRAPTAVLTAVAGRVE